MLKELRRALLVVLLAGAVPANAGETLKVGVSSGPYAEILEYAADIAKADGIEVETVEFSDYTMPNAALAQGDIDFNNFQHRPYLENQVKQRGYDIVAVEKSIIVPLGLYSKRLSSLGDLKSGATVAIPNDPSNEARSLILLEKAGLLRLRDGAGTSATLADIADNPKGVKITQLDAAQLPRSLDDVDAAAVTLNYALGAGLDPKKALYLEGADTPWNLWFATLRSRKDDAKIRRYIEIYRSPAVKDFIFARFDGTIIPTW
jgi:D-methionine transport system substrate-binding protein